MDKVSDIIEQIMFHVRKNPHNYPKGPKNQRQTNGMMPTAPRLEELNADGSEVSGEGKIYWLEPNVTEVGSDRSLTGGSQTIPLFGPYVHPKHCVIAYMDGTVTITPCSPNAEIIVNNRSIGETTILRDGNIVRIGRSHVFRFRETTSGPNRSSVPPAITGRQRNLSEPTSPRGGVPKSQTMPERSPDPNYFDVISSNSIHRLLYSSVGSSERIKKRTRSIGSNFETTFDLDGRIETISHPESSESSPVPISAEESRNTAKNAHLEAYAQPLRVLNQMPDTFATPNALSALISPQSFSTNTKLSSVTSPQDIQQRRPQLSGRDVIPAIIELVDGGEEAFITAVIRDADASKLQFKLAPVYTMYMTIRYRVSPHYRTDLYPAERTDRLAAFLSRVTDMLHVTIQDHCHDAGALAFWMANSSELLNFLKSDRDLCGPTSPEPQESLADAVQKAFGHLAACLRQDLHQALPAMLDQTLDDQSSSSPCLHMLTSAMILLRQCKVNAALTIQLFSQLFHHINMALFNWLLSPDGVSYCNRAWGYSLNRRLQMVLAWAEKQGLEMAANCHLCRVFQAAKLLEARKASIDDLANISSLCYKLNSLQIRELLELYQPEPSVEPPIPRELIENLVKIAETTADEATRSDGRAISVEEEAELHLPFLLPEDGYSADLIRDMPPGLREFVDFLMRQGICRMILQPSSSGLWTVHMRGYDDGETRSLAATQPQSSGSHGIPNPVMSSSSTGSIPMVTAAQTSQQQLYQQGRPEIATIRLNRGSGGIGLSIVAAQGNNQRELGIYIKKIVEGSLAQRDGRLQPGDQLLSVNGQSLIGLSQEKAAEYMAKSGPNVTFTVAKRSAFHNGLATLLNQPSPPTSQKTIVLPPAARVKSEELLNQQNDRQLLPDGHHSSHPAINGYHQQRFPSQQELGHIAAQQQPSVSNLQQIQRPPSAEVQPLHYQEDQLRSRPYMQKQIPTTSYNYPSVSQGRPQAIGQASQHNRSQSIPNLREDRQQHRNVGLGSQYTSNINNMPAPVAGGEDYYNLKFQNDANLNYQNLRTAETLPKDFNIQKMESQYQNMENYQNYPLPQVQTTTAAIPHRSSQTQYITSDQNFPIKTVPYTPTPMIGGRIAVPPNVDGQQSPQSPYGSGAIFVNRQFGQQSSALQNSPLQESYPTGGYLPKRDSQQQWQRQIGSGPDVSVGRPPGGANPSAYRVPVGQIPIARAGSVSSDISYPFQSSNRQTRQPVPSNILPGVGGSAAVYRAPAAPNSLPVSESSATVQRDSTSGYNDALISQFQQQHPRSPSVEISQSPRSPLTPNFATGVGSIRESFFPPSPLAAQQQMNLDVKNGLPQQNAAGAVPLPPNIEIRTDRDRNVKQYGGMPSYANVDVGKYKLTNASHQLRSVSVSEQPPGPVNNPLYGTSRDVKPLQVPFQLQRGYDPRSRLNEKVSPPRNVNLGQMSHGQSNSSLSPPQVPEPSPWEKEDQERTRQQIMKEVEMLMDNEIAELQAKPDRTEAEEDRLRALCLEREFQRRLREVGNGFDEDGEAAGYDEDHSPTSAMPSVPMSDLARVINEDLEKKRQDVIRWEMERRAEAQRKEDERREREEKQKKYFDEKYQQILEQTRRDKERERLEQEKALQIAEELQAERNLRARKEAEDRAKWEEEQKAFELLQRGMQNANIRDKRVEEEGFAKLQAKPVHFVDRSEANQMNIINRSSPTPAWDHQLDVSQANQPSMSSNNFMQPPPPPSLPAEAKHIKYTFNDTEETSMVIGAQEVYRDPRENRLKQLDNRRPEEATEKLSFAEKMRRFAKEAGEQTPKDRLKISSAQRDIEINMLTPQAKAH